MDLPGQAQQHEAGCHPGPPHARHQQQRRDHRVERKLHRQRPVRAGQEPLAQQRQRADQPDGRQVRVDDGDREPRVQHHDGGHVQRAAGQRRRVESPHATHQERPRGPALRGPQDDSARDDEEHLHPDPPDGVQARQQSAAPAQMEDGDGHSSGDPQGVDGPGVPGSVGHEVCRVRAREEVHTIMEAAGHKATTANIADVTSRCRLVSESVPSLYIVPVASCTDRLGSARHRLAL